MENITFDHFKAMDLRVAQIKTAEDIEGADKIYKVTVDMGEERIVVAGIKSFYTKEELIGKKVVVVANLEPKTLRGVISHGMILASSTEDKSSLTLITVDKDIPNGSKVS
ncbi:MAG: methionine--tRNA ligase subunit beta [bacterium]